MKGCKGLGVVCLGSGDGKGLGPGLVWGRGNVKGLGLGLAKAGAGWGCLQGSGGQQGAGVAVTLLPSPEARGLELQ